MAGYGRGPMDTSNDDIYSNFMPSAAPVRGGELGGGPAPMPAMTPMGQAIGPLRVPQSRGGPPGTRAGKLMSRMGPGGTAMQVPGAEEARPMTAVRAAGYTAAGKAPGGSGVFDPAGGLGASRGPAPPLQKRADNSVEDMCREMEREVNGLIEESARLAAEGRSGEALEKAKEAGKQERRLCQKREEAGLADQINIDLTYSVFFNLANQYHASRLYVEALKTYTAVVKNKQYHQSGRLRVNMGNIYFEQKKYANAIKMYRMALDQIPNTGREVRAKIMRNIGIAFVRLGQFQDAVSAFEQVAEAQTDVQAAFNLFLCYHALGDPEKMRKAFLRLLATRPAGIGDGAGEDEDEATAAEAEDTVLDTDGLREALRAKRSALAKCIATAAKILAPLVEEDVAAGFEYVVAQLRTHNHPAMANELEIAKALHFVRERQVDKAVEVLKSYEKKDKQLMARAATNLSFIYLHEGDINAAARYADVAMHHNRYNAKALVNKGNTLFARGELDEARQLYQEAMGADADCIEAIYNLAVTSKRQSHTAEALALFEKLHTILPSSVEVTWHIADIHDSAGDAQAALKWFNILTARVPTDPGVLARMGAVSFRDGDDAQAFHYHQEAFRAYPSDIDIIAWLGAYFVKNDVFERAVTYFDRAAQIQPNEVKWKLMVASCHRRSGDYPKAFEAYLQIHAEAPGNVECLRYLVQLADDMGKKDMVHDFVVRLRKAERAQDQGAAAAEQPASDVRGPCASRRPHDGTRG